MADTQASHTRRAERTTPAPSLLRCMHAPSCARPWLLLLPTPLPSQGRCSCQRELFDDGRRSRILAPRVATTTARHARAHAPDRRPATCGDARRGVGCMVSLATTAWRAHTVTRPKAGRHRFRRLSPTDRCMGRDSGARRALSKVPCSALARIVGAARSSDSHPAIIPTAGIRLTSVFLRRRQGPFPPGEAPS